jgi:hypothetical protein
MSEAISLDQLLASRQDGMLLALAAPQFAGQAAIQAGLGIVRRRAQFDSVVYPSLGVFSELLKAEVERVGLSSLGVRLDIWDKSDRGFLALCDTLYQLHPVGVLLYPADAEALAIASIGMTRGLPIFKIKNCGSLVKHGRAG